MFNIFITDIILVVIAIIWLIAASITDIKKREVADWLSFSLLAIALAINALKSVLTLNASYFLYSVLGAAIFFVIALVFYRTKVFGGGDAKLLIALGAAFATQPIFANSLNLPFQYHEPFLLTFVINILVIGAIYGIIFSLVLAFKNRKKFSDSFKKGNKENNKIFYFILAIVVLLLALITHTYNILFLAVVILILPYLFAFVKASESTMIRFKGWKDLAEGDWLVQKLKIKNKILKPTVDGLTKQDILQIKKANKKVLIKDGIPFVPAILIALILSIFIGNLLLLLMI